MTVDAARAGRPVASTTTFSAAERSLAVNSELLQRDRVPRAAARLHERPERLQVMRVGAHPPGARTR
ncbi:MAG TPA: hypothetical protein VN213_10750 [Solirubrobacteraceae bacterium]|nr:hypothetical protein [Solirubrobacteraceae bacterium]